MKQILLIFCTIAFLTNINKAQSIKTIPNGDFEIWDSISYYDIDTPWTTKNNQYVSQYGKPLITKVPGQIGSAIHIETVKIGTDTIVPILATNAILYSQKPIGISGYYRCHVVGNDTAFIIINFGSNAHIIKTEKIPFYGIDTLAFIPFNITLPDTLPLIPDEIIIEIGSSNLYKKTGHMPGNWLELDQFAFTGYGITKPIPDGNFDGWTTHSITKLEGWQITAQADPYNLKKDVFMSTDSHSGDYSVMLEFLPTSWSVQLTTGIFLPPAPGGGNGLSGGQPYHLKNDTLTGYYKYEANNTDSGFMNVVLLANETAIATPVQYFTLADQWTYFELPISAPIVPEMMRIDIGAGTFWDSTGGTKLYLDGLQLKSQPIHTSGILANKSTNSRVDIFPNPAQNQLNIKFASQSLSEFDLKIYNTEGQKMINESHISSNTLFNIDISQFYPGIYFYIITSKGKEFISKFVKEN